ncbi:MAG: hypothetical protein KF894_05985 [Labilithrix sp.]|nr:hypothetical protein [Labilithrix sp.]
MRRFGFVLVLLGLIGIIVGAFNGSGSLFAWNGRHPIDTFALDGAPTVRTLVPEPGRRYTVSVQVTFERAGLELHEGATLVEAKMPLVVRVKDPAGNTRAEAVGWLDPGEPPNVLYGQAVPNARTSQHPDERTGSGPTSEAPSGGRLARPPPELVVERLVGPFVASSEEPLSVAVDLGPDRVGRARIAERRLVIYDDALPPNIRNAFVVAGVGVVVFLAGLVVLVVAWFRRRGAPRKRGGIPAKGGV